MTTLTFDWNVIGNYPSKVASITRATERAEQAISRMGQAGQRDMTLFQRATNAAGRTGGAMRTMASGAAAAGSFLGAMALKMPVGKAMTFETAIANVDKAFSFESMTERSQFLALLNKMGPELGVTRTQIAGLAADFGRLGIAAAETPPVIQQAAQASAAFENFPIEVAGEAIGRIKTQFGLAAEGSGLFLDAVNTLADKTTAKGGDIMEVMSRVAGSMASIKMPAEQAAAFSTFGLEFFRQPELAASQINQLTGKLIELGYQADLQKDPLGTFQRMIDKIQSLPAAQRGSFIIEHFGEGNRALIEIMTEKTDQFHKTMGFVANKTDFAGSMLREFMRITGTTQFKWDQLKARLDSVFVTLGEKLLPTFQRLMEQATPLVIKFGEWVSMNPDMVKIGSAIMVAAIAAAPLLFVFGSLLGVISMLMSPIGLLFRGLLGVAGLLGLAFTPIGAIVVVTIGAAVAAIYYFRDEFGVVIDTVKNWFSSAFDWIAGKIQWALGAASSLLGLGTDETTPTLAGITPGVAGPAPLSAGAAGNSAVMVGGTIGVAVTGPGQVKNNGIQSTPPGIVGETVANRGAR